MPQAERSIFVTNDLDGVHFYAPPPLGTTVSLLRGRLSLPEEVYTVGEYIHPEGTLAQGAARLSVFFHKYRPLKAAAIKGLQGFKEIGDIHQREVLFAALSGRERDKHELTRTALGKAGYDAYFSRWLLNEGNSSAAWKEFQTRKLTEEGLTVVHLEDDLRAALCVARVNKQFGEDSRVLVYLFKNLSNHPYLLQRAGIELPSNVRVVSSFKEANQDFDQRLSLRSL